MQEKFFNEVIFAMCGETFTRWDVFGAVCTAVATIVVFAVAGSMP